MYQLAKLVSHFLTLISWETLNVPSIHCFRYLQNIFGSTHHAPHAVFKKISTAHNNESVLWFIELSECGRGGTPALEHSWIEENFMEDVMTKSLLSDRNFKILVKPWRVIDFGTYSFPSVRCGIPCTYDLCLLRTSSFMGHSHITFWHKLQSFKLHYEDPLI